MNKKNFIVLSTVLAMVVVMLTLFYFSKANADQFLALFQNYFLYAYGQDPISAFCIFFVLHAPYHIFLLPGYTLFVIAAGFFLDNALYTFFLLYIGRC